jgi:hypothetical protein
MKRSDFHLQVNHDLVFRPCVGVKDVTNSIGESSENGLGSYGRSDFSWGNTPGGRNSDFARVEPDINRIKTKIIMRYCLILFMGLS